MNRSALILPDDNSSIPLLDRLSDPHGCSPNPPGCYPNPTGCNPNPPGCNPIPPGSNPNPPGSNPYPPGCNPNPPGCDPNPPGCDPDHLGYHPIDNPYPMGNDLSLSPMSNHSTHYPMSGNPSIMGNNPNAMGYKPSNKLLRPLNLSPDEKTSSVEYVTPEKEMYNPSRFSISAFQKSKASSIWDVTDHNCTDVLRGKYRADQLEEMIPKHYLESDSEGE